MHPLDNVIWQALTTRQTEFAERFGHARRFSPAVTSLGAFLEPSEEGYESMAGLLGAGGVAALFLDVPYQPHPGWTLIAGTPLLQMVCENGSVGPSSSKIGFAELGETDVAEMVELATLTKPGPFALRTRELGTYVGIRHGGKLAAMAGERLKLPGYAEVSAVCTHPDHAGKGYARTLMTEIMGRIRDRNETPFLHVREDNVRAIELYRKLGFRERVLLHLAVLRKD